MGVVNVTPDSFSDGGRFLDPDAAVAHGLELADARCRRARRRWRVDPARRRAGRRPTRSSAGWSPSSSGSPPTPRVPVERRHHEGRGRRAPRSTPAPPIVNDVSAGRPTPRCLGVVADAGAGYVVMHMQGEPRTMQARPALRRRRRRGRRLPRRAARGRARRRRRRRRADGRPGHRIRQDGRAQPRAARRLARARRARRCAGAGRHVAQGVPRPVVAAAILDRRPTATTARWRPSSGRSSAARRWCACTTCSRPCGRAAGVMDALTRTAAG